MRPTASAALATPSVAQTRESRVKVCDCSTITFELFLSASDCFVITSELFSSAVDCRLIVAELSLRALCDCIDAASKAK